MLFRASCGRSQTIDSLEQIRADILSCQRCELRQSATTPVPGLGCPGVKYVLAGEAPGRDEDKVGIPFVGASGQKLDKLMKLAGLDINQIYLTNVCRCRPPKNRTPRKKEIALCSDFFWRELKLLKPEFVITLGATPLSLFTTESVTTMHGSILPYEFAGQKFSILPSYHPAAALHNPRLWADILEDWSHPAGKVNSDYLIRSVLPSVRPFLMSLDTETDGAGGLGCWSVAYRDETKQLCVTPFYGLRPEFQFGETETIFHNAKYDLRELARNRMNIPAKFHDTMIAAYCLGLGKQAPKDDSKSRAGSDMVGGLGLKYLMRRHLGMQQKSWKEVQPSEEQEYNAKDSVGTFLLFELWKSTLPLHYFTIDMPLLPVLMAMEDRGVKIDHGFLAEFGAELDKKLAGYEFPFNPHSPDQIAKYIYGEKSESGQFAGGLGIQPWKFTDGGKPSTDADTLTLIPDPVVKRLLEYKQLFQDKASYLNDYARNMDIHDRVHPEIKQTSTSTGRLSIARPHLQNMDKEGQMRKLVIAEKGKKLVDMDFNQLDFRSLAAITQDPILIEALNADKKIHKVAQELLGCTYREAKVANFALMFKGEAWRLSQELGITIDAAREFIKFYFTKFPGIKKYQDEQECRLKADKHATIPFTNRTRRIDAMFVDQWKIQQEGVREGIALPVQGLEAEVCKIVMIDLAKKSAPMILQVHDELLFEVDEKDALSYGHWLKEYVPTIVSFGGMKFTVEVSIGNNWWECGQEENKI